MSAKTDQFFEDMTAKTIEAIEAADEAGWVKPWAAIFGGTGLPQNAKTQKHYQGGNAIFFMLHGADRGYASSLWATYRQWEAIGGQVRKGEKGVQGIKWVVTHRCETCDSKGNYPCPKPGHASKRSMFPSVFTVFNYEQQDGFAVETPEMPENVVETDEAIEALLAASGADIAHKPQDRAYYTPGTDDVVLPLRETFESTKAYYATALHEVTHFTGDKSRLDREQRNVFGSERYAAEELVAEFGAVFLQAHFGLSPEPSANSASYIAGWLRTLKADPKNLYRAASAAQKAATWLLERLDDSTVEEVSEAA